jgi:hypothetical protein
VHESCGFRVRIGVSTLLPDYRAVPVLGCPKVGAGSATMDAREFFDEIVIPNYRDALQNRNNLRLIFNAVVSMNTAAEFIALEQLGYPVHIKEAKLTKKANAIRHKHRALKNLMDHAVTLKHVRRLRDVDEKNSVTSSSTAFASTSPATWEHLYRVLDEAMSVLRTLMA